jgi:uncharacterized protein YbcI
LVDQNKLIDISSYFSKLLRRTFGKGPHSCQTTVSNRYLVTYIRGFLSPMEEVLLQQEQYKTVDYARSVIINHLLEEIKGVVQVTFDVAVGEYFHDWNFPNNSGMIIMIFEEELSDKSPECSVDADKLEHEVARISKLVQKVPDQIYIFPISPTIYLIERKGILIQIEKALISKGFQEELRFTKDQLEKEYFHRYGMFDSIMNRSIKDIFIDWNFKEDKSMMALVLDK